MSKFAVGVYNQMENTLTIEIVEAADWRAAALLHSQRLWEMLDEDPGDNELQGVVPNTLDDAKQDAFDLDSGFDCVEIT